MSKRVVSFGGVPVWPLSTKGKWPLSKPTRRLLLEEESSNGLAVALVEEAAGKHYSAQAQECGYAIPLVQGKGVEQEELDDRDRQQA